MSTTTSAWKLIRPNGRPTRCLLSAINGHCDVIVWNGPSIVLWERHPRKEAASRRADELWTMLVAYGCRAPEEEQSPDGRPAYLRACDECGASTGTVRHRRGGYLVLFCARCGQSWNAPERGTLSDRRSKPREGNDRRCAA